MNKYIVIILAALTAVCCTEQKIPTYSGGHYLSFKLNGETDSTITSFFYYPYDTEIQVPVVMTLGGGPLAQDQQYELEVISQKSNALAKNYRLNTCTFRKGLVQDTAYITLIKSAELETQEYRLVFQVKQNGLFQFGQHAFRTGKLIFSSKTAKPAWWTETVQKAYLGVYSDTKYFHFMEATEGKGADFDKYDADGQRNLALQFLQYLLKNKENGNTIMDDGPNGTKIEMTITVVGS